MHTIATSTCRCVGFIIATQFCLIIYLQYTLHKTCKNASGDFDNMEIESVDVVYTWVNGSEERFLKQLDRANAKRGGKVKVDVNGQGRFDGKNELMYSLRGVDKHMPWIRHVYIVTNGQIPSWLNLHTGLVSVIPHESIFTNRSHLPTFSSPAIEANLHRIPGISKRFIYINDDFLIGAPVEYSSFYTPTDGQIFYWHYGLPNCADKCSWGKVANGKCDVACYVPECQLDGGDCPEPPEVQTHQRKVGIAFFESLQTTQRLFNTNFGFRQRQVMPHTPLLVDKDVMQNAWEDFPQELSNTSSHHFRDAYDLQFQFFYAFYTLEKTTIVSLAETLRKHDINDDGVLNNEEIDLMTIRHSQMKDKEEFRRILEACSPGNTVDFNRLYVTSLEDCETLGLYLENTLRTRLKYKSVLLSAVPSNGFYAHSALVSDVYSVVKKLNDLRRHPKKFICFNDDLKRTDSTAQTVAEVYRELSLFYHNLFPAPSRYELPEGEINPPGKYIQELTVNSIFKRGGRKGEVIGLEYNFAWTQYIVVLASLGILSCIVYNFCRRVQRFQ